MAETEQKNFQQMIEQAEAAKTKGTEFFKVSSKGHLRFQHQAFHLCLASLWNQGIIAYQTPHLWD